MSEIGRELKSIYSDVLVHAFVAVGIGSGIATGSLFYAVLVTGGLSVLYLGQDKHRSG